MSNSILNDEVMKYMGVVPYEDNPNEGDGYFLHKLIKSYGQKEVDTAFEFVKSMCREKEGSKSG